MDDWWRWWRRGVQYCPECQGWHIVLAREFHFWVQNIEDNSTHWRLVQHVPYLLQIFIQESRVSMKKYIAHTVFTTKLLVHPKHLRWYGQHILHSLQNYLCICNVSDDIYSTNRNRYNILFTSPECLWRNVLHIPYSPQNYLCIQNIYDDMDNITYTVLTTKLLVRPERLRRYVHVEYSLQNFIHESRTSMKKCIAHTVLTTKLLVHPERLRRYGQHNIYCAYYKITCTSRTSTTICTCRVLTTEFYSWVQKVYEEMYCTYRTHHKITCASRTSTTIWTTHTVLTTN
jgi:hypothetical protein